MKKSALVLCLAAGACASLVGQASAQYSTNFESQTLGILTGQDGWFVPVAGSADWQVRGFNDPAHFNVASSPDCTGNNKVAVSTGFGSAAGFARAQHPMNWVDSNVWTICVDIYVDYQGDPLTHASNVCSFSIQPGGTQGANMLCYWNVDGDITSEVSLSWNLFDSAGGASLGFYNPDDVAGTWPLGPFSTIKQRHWYRCTYSVDYTANRILKMGIKNLATGEGHVFDTTGTLGGTTANAEWNVQGGAGNVEALPRPSKFRMFVGGQGNGNVVAMDNVSFTPGDSLCVTDMAAKCPADFNNDTSVDFFDYDDFVVCFEGGVCPPCATADFNNDTAVDFFDYDDFVVAFETPC